MRRIDKSLEVGERAQFGIDQAAYDDWVSFTPDRPFNDMRYAVDATKISSLGWTQKTSFEKGLSLTVDWYKQFGEEWWGDISHCLTAFPLEEKYKEHKKVRRGSGPVIQV